MAENQQHVANTRADGRNSPVDLRIGTSGWHYKDWWGPFYPENLRKKDALSFYVTRFNTAELNAPFYRTPTLEAVKNWAESTPEDFRFAWKASRFITRYRRLVVNEASNLHDGRRRPLLQPSTRHGKSLRTLTLRGALRGLPAEGVGRDRGLGSRGRLSLPND